MLRLNVKKERRRQKRETPEGRKRRSRFHYEFGRRPLERKRTVGWLQRQDSHGVGDAPVLDALMHVFPDTSKKDRTRIWRPRGEQERERRKGQIERGFLKRENGGPR